MSELLVHEDVSVDASPEAADDEAREAAEFESANDVDEQPCGEFPLAARLESLLIAAERPMTELRLAAVLGLSGKGTTAVIRETIDELNADYERSGRAFRVERLAGGWQVMTTADYGPLLSGLYRERQQSKLSQAAMETLAIVAYRQPMIRAELEAIRGVACGEVLRGLLERRLLKIVGRAEELGRPMLYGTTAEFLKVFGLATIDDLPDVEGLDRGAQKRQKKERSKTDEPVVDSTKTVEDGSGDEGGEQETEATEGD